MPKVSVIMSVYTESPQIVKRAVDSILNQTLLDWEFIIVLDWPDNLALKKYLEEIAANDQRFTFLINDKNRGQGFSRNRAIELSKSNYIALQDGDDISMPNRLQRQYEYLNTHPEIDVLGSGIRYIDLDKDIHYYDLLYSNDIIAVLRKKSPCGHPTLMLKKEVFTEKGQYDQVFISYKGGQVFCEDYDLYIRWYLKGVKIYNLPEVLYIYHRDDASIGKKTKGMIRSVVDIKLKYHRQLKFKLMDYAYMAAQYALLLLPVSSIISIHTFVNKFSTPK